MSWSFESPAELCRCMYDPRWLMGLGERMSRYGVFAAIGGRVFQSREEGVRQLDRDS